MKRKHFPDKENFTFLPANNFLLAIPEWDRKKRIETAFIDYLGAEDTPYVRETSKMFFRALIAGADAGIKFDNNLIRGYHFLLVLIGDNCFKLSDFFRIIGGNFYKKDKFKKLHCMSSVPYDEIKLDNSWIFEFDDFATFIENNHDYGLRTFIEHNDKTADTSKSRPKYIEIYTIYRNSILVGTLDETDYSTKASLIVKANWRYIPIWCHKILNAEQLEKDKEQLLAEALFIHNETKYEGDSGYTDGDFAFSDDVFRLRLADNKAYDETRYKVSNNLKINPSEWNNLLVMEEIKKVKPFIYK